MQNRFISLSVARCATFKAVHSDAKPKALKEINRALSLAAPTHNKQLRQGVFL
jgi:hypothetical protein